MLGWQVSSEALLPDLLPVGGSGRAARVFGDPYEKDGLTVIPAAKVMGGGGGGGGEAPDGQGKGEGTGFGIVARPVGAYVIRGDEVDRQPAIDLNRIVAGVCAVVGLALLVALIRPR